MGDGDARRQAVEPQRSVIVQAPAGSGKTTLLVERYLGLLAVVEAPEEILAITFTRKAAAEMRQRILRYLNPEVHADAAHEQAALAKARAVRHKVAAWRLLENPQRLLIRTIDSFNHYLARTMPVASALGPVPAPADNTQAMYRLAARRVLALVDGNDALAADLEQLLEWRDHRSQDIEDLLTGLLGRREQWLRALSVAEPQRARLEAVLSREVTGQLARAGSVLQRALARQGIEASQLLSLLRYAAGTLRGTGSASVICAFAEADALPGADPQALPLWQGLAAAFLTNDGAFRRRIDKTIGFPPKTPEKDAFQDIIGALTGDDALRDALQLAGRLPQPHYQEDEWAVLEALVRVLKRAAAELSLVFAGRGKTDFAGLAEAALRGLGDEDSGYTDLGLYLDRRIQHILVDEFQDTNWGQLHLLEKLTAGWEGSAPGVAADGRSLFLVGDPMQSIYRFREAEVGLYIRCRDRGVGPLMLESKRLSRNFRSRAEIVRWVNERLGPIFPEQEDIAAGAVAYAASEPGRPAGGRVQILAHPGEAAEAEAIAELLAGALAAQTANPDFKAAIIVRARSHLQLILPALTRRSLAYRAVKLDPLTSRPAVQDLLALTRAIAQPADRAAVLAVLRSPVCGLTLEDLWMLAGDGRALDDPDALARLHEDARARALRVLQALADVRVQWRRRPLRDLVEGVWTRLGGPACCQHPATDLRDARLYLNALDQAAADGLLEDWNDFEELLADQHTEGDPPRADVKIEVLTMHGAKGLEWDLVVLPGLNRPPGGNDRALLHWLPFTAADGREQVLLAPLRSADTRHDPPLVELIRNEQKTRSSYENQRLLYVATTRAKEQLVLSACLDPTKDEIRPATGSLLADLWPTTGEDFRSALTRAAPGVAAGDGSAPASRPDQTLRRIAGSWQASVGERLAWKPALPPRERAFDIEYNWAGMQARRTGTVLHRLLERVGRTGIEALADAQRQRLIQRIPKLLRAMGTRSDNIEEAGAIVRAAFEQTLNSSTGRWLLSNRHRDAACELSVAGVVDGQLLSAVVDRTFVDAEDTRWIIDYKSGYHAGADLQSFLDQERERYQAQLSGYRRLFAQIEQRRIRTALYLPRHDQLIEVG
ncbi:MAG: UvrD-helicase domain-containing protein [Pseudomonadales bacterium]